MELLRLILALLIDFGIAESQLNILRLKMNKDKILLAAIIIFSIVSLVLSLGAEIYLKYGSC